MCSLDLKRPSLGYLIFSLVVIMVCSANVPAAPPGWNITQLTNNNYDDYSPGISGSNIAWVERDDVNDITSLLFYNGSTTIKLSDHLEDETFQIHDSNVAWVEHDDVNDITSLLFYNGSTTIKLSDHLEDETFQIYDSNVVWVEYDNDISPLFFYNGRTTTKLSDNVDRDSIILFRSNVIWREYDYVNEMEPLFFYNGSTITKLAADVDWKNYKTSGANVIWKEYDDVNYVTSIFIFTGSTITKWSDSIEIYNFEISGSNAIWEGYNEEYDTSPLFFFNGSTIIKLSDHLSDDIYEFSGSNVFWLEYYYGPWICFYNGTTTTKVADSINEDSLKVSGSNAVWTKYDEFNDVTQLYFCNGSTVTKLSDNIEDDYHHENYYISGSNVIWEESDEVNDAEPLFFFNGSAVTKLSDDIEIGTAGIYGSTVTWFEWDEVNDVEPLFVYNGSTVTKLSSSGDIEIIRISGSNVFWTEWDEVNEVSPLMVYNGQTIVKLADNALDSDSIYVSGSYVAWLSYDGNDNELFFATQLAGLLVTLGPEEVIPAGAQWNVDGGDWQDSGAIVTGLLPGLHTMNYKSIDGWIAPVSESVTLIGGPATSLSRTYAPQPGNIQIALGPADAVLEGVQWNVDGSNWQNSGAVVTGLSIGSHIVDYKSVAGWIAPASESVIVNRAATTSLGRTYAPQPGNIQITLVPSEAVSDGAQWNVDGGEWQDSGTLVTNLTAGSHTVNYKSITGWFTPASESVTINRGATTSISRNYTPLPGNIQITLAPVEAVSDGAQWNVDGGAWQNNGATIMGLSVGSHTVNYRSLTGWNAPVSEAITINRGATNSINRNYTIQPGNIQVTLGPADAVVAGAQWNVDGGGWQNSGAEVTGLPPGLHTVNYKSIAGWIAHASELITITKGSTTSISRIYTQQARGLLINKCNIAAGRGINDNNDIINFSGTTGITPAELSGSDEITIKVGDVYSEAIPISSFTVKNGKFTYTRKIPRRSKGAITSLVIDTNKHKFSLKTRNIDLSGLHCPFDIEFDTSNYRGVSSIYENTANGKKFIPVPLMSGVDDYLQIKSVKVKKGRLSDTLAIRGGIAYAVLPTLMSDVVVKLGSQTFTLPAKNFKPSGKSGHKYVCKDIVIPGGIASATFDFGKCTFTITIKNVKINTTTGKVGLTLTIGSFDKQVNFDFDTGQAIYSELAPISQCLPITGKLMTDCDLSNPCFLPGL
ncbi:MAG: hypothetical protein ABSH16_06635 [Sedimentisphaerales bacterium]